MNMQAEIDYYKSEASDLKCEVEKLNRWRKEHLQMANEESKKAIIDS